MRALLARHPASAFFALTLTISWGGLLVIVGRGGFPGAPGDVDRWFPVALVVLLAGPAVAALVLTGATGGRGALRALGRRVVDVRIGARWLAIAVLATPLAILATLGLLALASPAFRPAIASSDDPWGLLLAGIGIGLIGGLLEELGWTGFAVSRLRRRHGALATGLTVGIVWAAWHLPVTVWASGDPTGALAWPLLVPPLVFYLGVLPPYRILMVWVYDRSGSLLAVILMHASLTAATLFVLPPQEAVLVPTYLVWSGLAWLLVAVLVSGGAAANRPRGEGDGGAACRRTRAFGASATPSSGAPRAGDLAIRPLAPGEARALASVMRRSFGGLAGMVFSPGKVAFVAEQGGRIVGGVTLGAFRIDAARRGGVVKWLFTLPEARGSGVASALVDRALAWFAEQGVTDAFACVEGLNAGSSNRFARRGFAPLGFVEQVRRYGAGLARVWWHANHVVDVGHLLWARTPDGPPEDVGDEATARWGVGGLVATVGLHVAVGVVMLLRLGVALTAADVAQVAVAVVAVVGVRTAALALVGGAQGLGLRYRPWETGLLLAGAIALLFGGAFVAPGTVVPRSRTWSPRALAPALARMAFAGAAAVLVLGWLAWWAVAAGMAPDLAQRVLLYARVMLLAEVLLPFFPLTAFAGRRVLEASPLSWGALAAGTVALWLVAPVR